jgi:uncharacterized damage-inducible protein DinB
MATNKLPEVWLRGPLEGMPALLQPVAHALLQAQEEIHELLQDFPASKLWEQPAGVASVGFHLQHMVGVLDRLLTYADGGVLAAAQLEYLAGEGKPAAGIDLPNLLAAFDQQLATTLENLKATDPHTLTAVRGVGRKQTPSTVVGLLFHAAEHTMRHTGQLLVTVRVLQVEKGV